MGYAYEEPTFLFIVFNATRTLFSQHFRALRNNNIWQYSKLVAVHINCCCMYCPIHHQCVVGTHVLMQPLNPKFPVPRRQLVIRVMKAPVSVGNSKVAYDQVQISPAFPEKMWPLVREETKTISSSQSKLSVEHSPHFFQHHILNMIFS